MNANPAAGSGYSKHSVSDGLYGQLLQAADSRFEIFAPPSEPPSLFDYVNSTVHFTPHDWQRLHLCPLLERLRTEVGLRICIHAGPQYGKSVVTSQRLPAYLIGCDPLARVGLACYNETHATGFGQVILDLMQDPTYAEVFPDSRCRVPGNAPAGRFRTAGREAERDGQYSFIALGLQSGFVGKGVDHLIIDDPYKSADEARSETINEKVWRWWTQTAGPRIPDTTNVVVMFHRYHEDDFAGRLLASGKWEYYRFPAIADDNADGSDPTGRQVGELLSPMRSRQWLEAQEKEDPQTFLGQFQGTPRPQEGAIFKTAWFANRYRTLPSLSAVYTIWDTALKDGEENDETASMVFGEGNDGGLYILRSWSDRLETPDVVTKLIENAYWLKGLFGETYQGDYVEDKVSGTTLMQYVRRHTDPDKTRGHDGYRLALIPIQVEADKVARAKGVTPMCAAGRILFPDTGMYPQAQMWMTKTVGQITAFPFAKHDDLTDVFVYGLKRFIGTLKTTKSRRGKSGGWS